MNIDALIAQEDAAIAYWQSLGYGSDDAIELMVGQRDWPWFSEQAAPEDSPMASYLRGFDDGTDDDD